MDSDVPKASNTDSDVHNESGVPNEVDVHNKSDVVSDVTKESGASNQPDVTMKMMFPRILLSLGNLQGKMQERKSHFLMLMWIRNKDNIKWLDMIQQVRRVKNYLFALIQMKNLRGKVKENVFEV